MHKHIKAVQKEMFLALLWILNNLAQHGVIIYIV